MPTLASSNNFLKDFLAKYPDAKSKEICKEILQKDIISFDIFDTLLVRSVYSPTDVFKLMEHDEKLDSIIKTFYSLRTYFESNTRTLIKTQHPKYEDITLDEIYANMQQQLALSDADTLYLKNLELATEKKVLYPRLYVQELYNLAKALKKKIIIVSDMYLTPDILTDLLHHNGFNGFDKLYLSSKIKLTKASGNLFKHILADLKVMPNTILHMSDNYKTDILKGQQYAITAIYLPATKNKFSELKFCLTCFNHKINNLSYLEQTSLAIISNKLFHNPFVDYDKNTLWNGSAYNMGYTTFAPAVFNTIISMVNYAKINKIDTIFFLLRDGYIPKMIFDKIKVLMNAEHIKGEYLLSNRHNSYSYLLLHNPELLIYTLIPHIKTTTDLISFFTNSTSSIFTINTKLAEINIFPKDKLNTNVDLLNLLKIIANNLDDDTLNSIKNFANYLKNKIDKKKNNLIFDVGYSGSAQFVLKQLGYNLKAFYFAVNHTRYYATITDKDAFLDYTYLINSVMQNESITPLLELAISYPYPVSSMIKALNLNYKSVINRDDFSENLTDILLIQAGIEDFTTDYLASNAFILNYYKPTNLSAYYLFEYFDNIISPKDIFTFSLINSNTKTNFITSLSLANDSPKAQIKVLPQDFNKQITILKTSNHTPRAIKRFIQSIQKYGVNAKKSKFRKTIIQLYIKLFYQLK